jgi:hypothetical protein
MTKEPTSQQKYARKQGTMELIHGDFFHTASNSSNLPCGRVIRFYTFLYGDFLPKNFTISNSNFWHQNIN